MTIDIVGAGLAGLIASNMLASRIPSLIEQQDNLPNNHSAVLRFRSTIVGDVTGIPFRKVDMAKSYLPWRNTVADSLNYSYKGGIMRSDRSITALAAAGGTIADVRYIAPPDLVYRLANRYAMHTGQRIRFNQIYEGWTAKQGPIISTIPMPVLMQALDYPKRDGIEFIYQHGVNIRGFVKDCDSYVSMLIPDPKLPFTRISITGSELIVEIPRNSEAAKHQPAWMLSAAIEILGVSSKQIENVEVFQQRYAKIMPIDDDKRREFIHWATDMWDIYSLGRYAIWKPPLLLDDLVNDVRRIERWIGSDKYSIAQARR